MATINYDKDRKRWVVTWHEAGLRKRKSFKNDKVAKPYHAKKQFEEECIAVGETPFRAAPFTAAAKLWLREWFLTKSWTYKASEKCRVNTAIKYFKRLNLHEIGVDKLNAFFIERRRSVAEKTAHSEMVMLHNVFTWGMKRKPHRFCKSNPVLEIDLGTPTPKKKRRAAKPGEFEKILAASCPCCVAQIEIVAEVGLRLGELEQLNKEDFDLEHHVLEMKHCERLRLKHGTSGRVPLSDRAEELVRSLPPGPVLKMNRARFVRHWRATRRAVGSDLLIHELRHTYVTRKLEDGVPVNYVKEFARHKDIKTTLRYAHQSDEVAALYRNSAAKSYQTNKSLISNTQSEQSSVQVQHLTDQVLAELQNRFSTLGRTDNNTELGKIPICYDGSFLKNQQLVNLITEICGEMLSEKRLKA